MDNKVTWQKITLKLRNPFRISYGMSETRQAFLIHLKNGSGWGESTIPPYYGVDTQDMIDVWHRVSETSQPFPNEPAMIPAWIGDGPAPARCGLDLALHDRIARKHRKPLYELLELPFPEPKTSSFTLALDNPSDMAKMALAVSRYPIIKVKLGGDSLDLERLKAIRAVRPDAILWVDVNGGWTFEEALHLIPCLEAVEIGLLEQPLVNNDIAGMGKLQTITQIPIVADESVQNLQDIEDLARAGVQGVNIKLMKVGGLSVALRMIHRSRELGLKVMLGCMIETAIGTTAMAHLGGLADWLDLDASILIENDPFDGMIYDETATVWIRDRVGIGVMVKPNVDL
jgi:L-Ala-D/L-Glu epimerase